MTPAVAAWRLACALALAAALGLFDGFLRPLRPRHTLLSDGIFLLTAAWVWIYLCFGICGGDIRAGCAVALAAGGIGWEATAGRPLRPVFVQIWRILARLRGLALLPAKKFFNFTKFYVHLRENGLQ